MELRRACRWGLAALLAAAAVPANAAAAQVIAPRDVSAAVAVGRDGRAFVVSPSARPDSGTLSPVRRRCAARGSAFGPSRVLLARGRRRAARRRRVAADGSGVIVLQRGRSVRTAAFAAGGRVGPSTRSPRAAPAPTSPPRPSLRAAPRSWSGTATATRGAGGWRPRPRAEAARFGAPRPISAFARRPCCTGRVGGDRRARRRRGGVDVDGSAPPCGRAAPRGPRLPRAAAPRRRRRRPAGRRCRGRERRSGADLQHPARPPARDRRAPAAPAQQPGGAFGPAEHVNPHGRRSAPRPVTRASARPRRLARPAAGFTVHLSEAAPGALLAATAGSAPVRTSTPSGSTR